MKLIFYFFICLAIYSAPTPPTLDELIQNSDFIAKSKLTSLKEKKLSKYTISVNTTSEIIKVYKEKSKLPEKLDLAFTVLPEYYGKWLKAVPSEGEYIIFYIQKEIKDSKGNTKKSIQLYEPHIFAFKEVTKELEEVLNKLK